jgi:hypothetical protein
MANPDLSAPNRSVFASQTAEKQFIRNSSRKRIDELQGNRELLWKAK